MTTVYGEPLNRRDLQLPVTSWETGPTGGDLPQRQAGTNAILLLAFLGKGCR